MTIYKVAEKAGVSPKTVSRVINGESYVRSETRRKVQDAIAELNFTPSTHARMMKAGRSRVIGVLTDSVVTTPESIEIARGIQAACIERGLTPMFVAGGDAAAPFSGHGYATLKSLNIDGLIYASHAHEQVSVTDFQSDIPLILVNCFDPAGVHSSIVPDDRVGGYLAAEHLIDLGHVQVAYLTLQQTSVATHLRKEGFLNAFRVCGLAAPFVIEGVSAAYKPGDFAKETAELQSVLNQVLALDPRPTALFCGNDKMAMAVYGMLQERDLKIPQHMSVLGFDDFAMITELMRPQLSSVSLPYFEMGQIAVQTLITTIEDEKPGLATRLLVPGEVRARGSIAVAAKSQEIPVASQAEESLPLRGGAAA